MFVYLVIILGVGVLCYKALDYAVANKAVTALGQQKEVIVQNFNLSVDAYLTYRLSGNRSYLTEAIQLMGNVRSRLTLLSRLDSVLRPGSMDLMLFRSFLETRGLETGYGVRDVQVGQWIKLADMQPEEMSAVQNLSRQAHSKASLLMAQWQAVSNGTSVDDLKALDKDLEEFVALAASFGRQVMDMSDWIHRKLLVVFSVFVVMLVLGLTVMLLYLVRSVSLKRQEQREQWIFQGLSELDNHIRGNHSPQEISDRIIRTLNRVLGVSMSSLYVCDQELRKLKLSSASGLKMDELQKELSLGEGFSGQAALQEGLQIMETGGAYHKFYGATGEIIPEFVYLLPLRYNEELQGVVELACGRELDAKSRRFLEQSADRLAVALSSALMVARNSELLLKNKEQAEAIQQQQQELNQSMHATLIRQKALLDSMLRTLPDNIYFKDLESRFLRISDSMVRFFGVKSAEDVIGKSDFDFKSPEKARKYFEEEQTIIRTGKGFYDEIVQQTDSEGNEVWSSISKLPLYDETGQCIGTFGISKNITNFKKLEQSVREQNEQLLAQQKELQTTISGMVQAQEALKSQMAENAEMHQLLEWEKSLMDALLGNVPDLIYFKDSQSRFVKVSASMARRFGLEDPAELVGKTDFDIQDAEHARQAFEDEQTIMRTRTPVVGLVEKEKSGDEDHYVLTTKMPLLDHEGKVLGTFGISKDITELKNLEMEVTRQNEELMVQQEELRVTNDELNAQQEELKAANEELQSQEEELRVTNEELEERGKELEMERKEVEHKNKELVRAQNELLQKARDLEQASRYKSDFLANMSHELRTPLNSLLILSKILASNKAGNLTPDQVKSASIIYNSGKDLLELINEVLDLSKIEAGKMTIELAETEISGIAGELLQLFRPVAEEKKLQYLVEQEKDCPEQIVTDRQRLMQIVRNLLSNAFKFTASGSVVVRLGLAPQGFRWRNSDVDPGPLLRISVQDSGVGIPQAKLSAIFEAFQQADGSISRRFGGTGLGLSISRQLVRMLGGEIHVESAEGTGSLFTIYLPLTQTGSAPEVAAPVLTAPAQKTPEMAVRVVQEVPEHPETSKLPFLIEDDRDMDTAAPMILIIHADKVKARKILKLSRKRGFHGVVSGDIAGGVRLAEAFRPKAIILAAELNSLSEAAQLRQSKWTAKLPVHIVSVVEEGMFDQLGESVPQESKESHHPVSITSRVTDGNNILLVEDDSATRQTVRMLLEEKEVQITEAVTANQAYGLLKTQTFDCVILDLGLPDYSGKELLEKLKAEKIVVPNVIIHTARELSEKEFRELQKLSSSIVVKGLKSDERLMDEVTLFLHHLSREIPGVQEPREVVPADSGGFKGKKVLIVDDDIRNIFALAQVLEENGVEIMEAENGQVAIDLLEQNPDIDLILMDLMMPEMDGFQAMKVIRAMDAFKDIPIITVSAKAMKEDHLKALEVGANDYISKPVDDGKLLSLLKIWLNKKR